MWQYRETPDYENPNELMHYGVLGMKWGVRKDPSKAYRKASNKMKRLNRKVEKKQASFEKKRDKAEKAARKTYTWSLFKYSSRQIGTKSKMAAKAEIKYNRAVKKAQRWEKNMRDTFSTVRLNQINSDDLKAGREYVDMLRRR